MALRKIPFSTWPTLPAGGLWSPFRRHPPDSWRRDSGTSNKSGTFVSGLCRHAQLLHVGRLYWIVWITLLRMIPTMTCQNSHVDITFVVYLSGEGWYWVLCQPHLLFLLVASSSSSSASSTETICAHRSLPDLMSGYSQLDIRIVESLLGFFLIFLMTFLAYLLTSYLAYLLTVFLTYLLTFCLTSFLSFLAFFLTFFLAYLLSFFLAFFLAHLLTRFLPFLLTFFVPSLLAFCLTLLAYLLTFCLTILLPKIKLAAGDRGWGGSAGSRRQRTQAVGDRGCGLAKRILSADD